MRSSFVARALRVQMICLVVVAMGLLLPPLASASVTTGPVTWSALTPQEGAAGTEGQPKVSVTAYDPSGIADSGFSVVMNGVEVEATLSYKLLYKERGTSVFDTHYATLTASLKGDAADAMHSVSARVTNALGVVSTVSWTSYRSGLPAQSAVAQGAAYDAVIHTALDSLVNGTWPSPGDSATYNPPYAFTAACSGCHALELNAEHTNGCVSCHPAPRDSFAVWDKTCLQPGCHAALSAQHTQDTSPHAMAVADVNAGCGFINSVNGRRPCHYRDLVQEHNRTINLRIDLSTAQPVLKQLSVTCVECHASTAYAGLGGAWNGTCSDCHDGTTLPNHTIYGTARYDEVYAKHSNPAGYYDNGSGNVGSNAIDAMGWVRENPDALSPNRTIGCGAGTCHTAAYLGGGWPFYGSTCRQCHGPSIAVPDPYQGDYAWYSEDWVDSRSLDTRLTMTLAPMSLPASSSLDFKTWYDIEDGWDYGYVQVSTDGGTTWVNLLGSITTNTNPYDCNLGNGITGSTRDAWVDAHFNLAAYAGQTVRIRFAYVADSWTYGLGWLLDNISIGPVGAPVFTDDVETLKPEWSVSTYLTYYDSSKPGWVTTPTNLTGWERFTRTP